MTRYDRDGVLAHTDLPTLLDELTGPAHGTGTSARWRCPDRDHEDLHPSVSVMTTDRGEQRWRCWSGGHGGTAIDLVMSTYRVSFQAAIEELARRAGVDAHASRPALVRPPTPAREPVPLHRYVVKYVEICEQLLWRPEGQRVLDYLTNERGLDPDVLRANRVGADPGPARLRRPSGLPASGPGAVLPVLDRAGEVVYVQTRYLAPGEAIQKYGNPHRRMGDNPRHGWTLPAPSAGRPAAEAVVVCEGLIDALTINDAGYHAVAVLGAMNTNPRVLGAIAAGIGRRPAIVAFDGDIAGQHAAQVVTEALQMRGMLVTELPLPSGGDLNSWAQTQRTPGLGPALRAAPTPAPHLTPVPPSP